MMAKRRTKPPNMLLWDRRQQARFSEAVDQVVSRASELGQIIASARVLYAEAAGLVVELRELVAVAKVGRRSRKRVPVPDTRPLDPHTAAFDAALAGLDQATPQE